MANEDAFIVSGYQNYFNQWSSGESDSIAEVGNDPTYGINKGAFRFTGINIAQGTSVYSAQLKFFVASQGTNGGGSLKAIIYGMDEDNTALFTSNPFGRSKTSASNSNNSSLPGVGNYFNFDVKDIVNEILARGGWSSGNAMGFMIEDNGSDANYWIYDTYTGTNSLLVIRLAVEPNFFPTPGSISEPTFPPISHQGLKVSMPGYDVRVATESQLLLTTRKKEFKIIKEAGVDCTSSVEKQVAHGLSYAPAHLAYVEGGGYRLKLNRYFLSGDDPITGGVNGQVGADSNNVLITVGGNKNVYYYIFIDPLNES